MFDFVVENRHSSQTVCIQTPALKPDLCVTLGKSLNHLYLIASCLSGDNDSFFFFFQQVLERMK